MSLDNIYVRVILTALLVLCAYRMPLVSLLFLMAIGLVYIERNRRKVTNTHIRLGSPSSQYMTVEEEGISQGTVPVLPFQEPESVESWFVPINDSTDDFVPVAPSINIKMDLGSVPNGEKAVGFFS